MRGWPIAGDVLLPTIEQQLHRCVRLTRQMSGNDALIPCAELGAESAAHVFRDHTDLALRNFENLCELIPYTGRSLRGGVDRYLFRLPINDEPVRLQRRVRLHLREVLTLDNCVGLGVALFHVSYLLLLGSVRVAALLNAFRTASSAGS